MGQQRRPRLSLPLGRQAEEEPAWEACACFTVRNEGNRFSAGGRIQGRRRPGKAEQIAADPDWTARGQSSADSPAPRGLHRPPGPRPLCAALRPGTSPVPSHPALALSHPVWDTCPHWPCPRCPCPRCPCPCGLSCKTSLPTPLRAGPGSHSPGEDTPSRLGPPGHARSPGGHENPGSGGQVHVRL